MRGQPWSKPDARALKWAKRLTIVSMFGYACLMAGALLGMSGCATTGQNTVTSPPVRVYDSKWQEDVNEKNAACWYAANEVATDGPDEVRMLAELCALSSGIVI